jgi:hypothetical protein
MVRGVKTIELRGGPANGRRVTIADGHDETTLPGNSADKFSARAVYLPTPWRCTDGTEIWDEHVESKFGETGLGNL